MTILLSKFLLHVDKTMFMQSNKSKFISLKCRGSSRSQMLYKITVLKSFAKFTEKYLLWSPFESKVEGSSHVTKRYSIAGDFILVLRHFFGNAFYKKPSEESF